MPSPTTDLVAFLTAATPGYAALGAARFVVLLVFYGLVVGSAMLLVVNLRDDRAQRSGRLLWMWLTRVLVGCAWFKVMLDTLPLGEDNGLHAWLSAAATRSAVPEVARLVRDGLLANYGVADPLLFVVTFLIAAALILGLFVRVSALAAAALTLLAWLGLYGDPGLWSWGFPLLTLLCGTLCVFSAGRALGADAYLRRAVPAVRDRRAVGLPLRLLT